MAKRSDDERAQNPVTGRRGSQRLEALAGDL